MDTRATDPDIWWGKGIIVSFYFRTSDDQTTINQPHTHKHLYIHIHTHIHITGGNRAPINSVGILDSKILDSRFGRGSHITYYILHAQQTHSSFFEGERGAFEIIIFVVFVAVAVVLLFLFFPLLSIKSHTDYYCGHSYVPLIFYNFYIYIQSTCCRPEKKKTLTAD